MKNFSYELNLAAQNGKLPRVKELIEVHEVSPNATADIRCTNRFYLSGSTALHQACQNLKTKVVEYLLSKKADVNATAGDEEYTPLHAIATCSHKFSGRDNGNVISAKEIVTLLMRNGANPYAVATIYGDRQVTPTDLSNMYSTTTVAQTISQCIAEKKVDTKKPKRRSGLTSPQLLEQSEREYVINTLGTFIRLEEARNGKITSGSGGLDNDLQVIFDHETNSIKIQCKIDLSLGNSDDLPNYVFRAINNIPKSAINIQINSSIHRRGFGGLNTHTGNNIVVIQVDVKALREHMEKTTKKLEKAKAANKKALEKAESQLEVLVLDRKVNSTETNASPTIIQKKQNLTDENVDKEKETSTAASGLESDLSNSSNDSNYNSDSETSSDDGIELDIDASLAAFENNGISGIEKYCSEQGADFDDFYCDIVSFAISSNNQKLLQALAEHPISVDKLELIAAISDVLYEVEEFLENPLLKLEKPLLEKLLQKAEGLDWKLFNTMLGNLDALKEEIKCQDDLSLSDEYDEQSLLFFAVIFRHVSVVDFLCERGTNVNDTFYEIPILHLAIFLYYPEIVRILCKHDANLDVQVEEDDDTVLMLAAAAGYLDIVKELCDREAALNIKDNDGYTAIMHALENKQFDVFIELWKRGADLSIQPSHTVKSKKAQEDLYRKSLLYALEEGDSLLLQALVAMPLAIDAKTLPLVENKLENIKEITDAEKTIRKIFSEINTKMNAGGWKLGYLGSKHKLRTSDTNEEMEVPEGIKRIHSLCNQAIKTNELTYQSALDKIKNIVTHDELHEKWKDTLWQTLWEWLRYLTGREQTQDQKDSYIEFKNMTN